MPKPATIAPLNLKQSVVERKRALADLDHWELKGAIAVKEANKGFSASLLWQQYTPTFFHLQFSGPLGAGKIKIIKNNAQATLISGNKSYTSNNADALLKQHTGHSIPINSLFYWIRALPNPAHPSSIEKDSYGHISELKQLGWHIAYVKFTHIKHFDVPAKLILTKENIKVKIIISTWA